jgi:phage terminase large subunit-like protein
MVKATIENELREQGRAGQIRIIIVTATRSKQLRAEPVVSLYEQSHVIHSGRDLAALETEMLEWVPGKGASPNRVDALVWAMTELGNLNPPASIGSAKGLRISRSRNPFGRRNP